MKKDIFKIDRRKFLKFMGVGAAATVVPSCVTKDSDTEEYKGDAVRQLSGKMTYRTNPKTEEQVSLLGYGCMRLPMIQNDAEEDVINQEEVNKLVDYAIKYGVNLFDTSPAYCKGMSERAMGIALSRYPRESYFLSTKLSNFAESTWSREKSLEMYHNSFKELQTDYIDYLHLHGIGMNGMDAFNARYINNGVLDYLLKV